MDANFAGQCENVKNFSKDRIFASDRYLGIDDKEVAGILLNEI